MGVIIMKTIEELQEEYNNSTGVRRARAAIELRNQGVDPEAPRAARQTSTATTTKSTSNSRPPVPPRPDPNRGRPLPPIPTAASAPTKSPNGVSDRVAALQAAQRPAAAQQSSSVNRRNAPVTTDTHRLAATTRAVVSAADTSARVRTAEAAVSNITVNDRGIVAKVKRVLGFGGTHEEIDRTAQVIMEAINAMISTNCSAHSYAVADHDQGEWTLVKQYIEPLRAKVAAPDIELLESLKQLANAIVNRRENKQRSVTFRPIEQAVSAETGSQSPSTSVTSSTSDNSDESQAGRSRRWGVRFPNGFGGKSSYE